MKRTALKCAQRKSKFDVDFSKAFNGQSDEKAEAGLLAAEKELARVKTEQEERKAKARAEAQAQINALDNLLNSRTTEQE